MEEKLQRFEVLLDNLKHIYETNKKVSSYWLGLNEFSDLSHEKYVFRVENWVSKVVYLLTC